MPNNIKDLVKSKAERLIKKNGEYRPYIDLLNTVLIFAGIVSLIVTIFTGLWLAANKIWQMAEQSSDNGSGGVVIPYQRTCAERVIRDLTCPADEIAMLPEIANTNPPPPARNRTSRKKPKATPVAPDQAPVAQPQSMPSIDISSSSPATEGDLDTSRPTYPSVPVKPAHLLRLGD